jgi:hypothetical protein
MFFQIDLGNVYPFLISIGILWIILSPIALKKIWQRLADITFLKYAGVLAVISGFLFTISILLSQQGYTELYFLDFLIYSFMAIIFFLAYYYFEGLLGVTPPIKRFMFIFGSFIIIEVILIYTIFVFDTRYGLLFVVAIYGSIVSIFALNVIIHSIKNSKEKAFLLDLFAVSMIFLAMSLFEIMEILYIFYLFPSGSEIITSLYIIGNLLFFIALVAFVGTSYRYSETIHFIPIEVHALMLYNKGGILVYHQTFNPENHVIKLAEHLISGALMSFSSFFKESFGTKAKLSYINASSFEFLFTTLRDDIGEFVIIASKANYYLKQSLSRFTKNIPDTILDKINLPGKTLNSDEELKILLKKAFPYLKF